MLPPAAENPGTFQQVSKSHQIELRKNRANLIFCYRNEGQVELYEAGKTLYTIRAWTTPATHSSH